MNKKNKNDFLFDLSLISRYRQEVFGISILWIMLLHGSILDKMVFPQHLEMLAVILKHGNVGVDVFLFLSGLGLYYSYVRESDIGIYLKKRLARVLVPFLLIGGTYYIWWDVILHGSFQAFLRDITLINFVLGGNKTVWYVYGILLCYILFPYFYAIIYEKDGRYKETAFFRICAAVTGLTLLVFMIQKYYPDFYECSESALTRIPVFFLGIAAAKLAKDGRRVSMSFPVLCWLIVLTAYPILKAQYIVGIYQRYYYCILGIALTVFFTTIFHMIRWEPFHKLFCWFGAISFELYLYHILLRNVYMKSSWYDGHVYLKYLILLLVSVFLAKLTSVGLKNFHSTVTEEKDRKRGRILWVDQLKGLTFFFVILGHMTISMKNFGVTAIPNDIIKILIYSFHMPLYFFLSGFTMNRQKIRNQSYGSYIYKIGKNLLIPYMALNLALFPLWIVNNKILTQSAAEIVRAFQGIFISNPMTWAMPSGALWFMTVLFGAQAVYAFIIKCTRGDHRLQLPIMIALAIFAYHYRQLHLVWHINVTPAAVVFLYCGNLYQEIYHSTLVQEILKPRLLAIPVILAGLYLWVRLCLYNGRISMTGADYGKERENIFLYYFCALLMILILIYLIRLLPKMRFLTFIGQNTMFYMAIHTPLIYLIYALWPEQMESGPFILLMACVLFIGIIPLAWLCKRFFPYLIGRKYEEDRWIRILRPWACCCMAVVPIYLGYQFFAAELLSGAFGKPLVIITTILLCLLGVDIYNTYRN